MGILQSGIFGNFCNQNDSLEEAIRAKQKPLMKKLNLHTYDAFLEVDTVNCLFSFSFCQKYHISCDCIVEEERMLWKRRKMTSLFVEYKNLRIFSLKEWQKAFIPKYYDAIVITSSFTVNLSFWKFQEFLQLLWTSARINCLVYIELYACSRWNESFVDWMHSNAKVGISRLLSVKCFIHAIHAVGFEILEVENHTNDAIKTVKCQLSNLKAQKLSNSLESKLECQIRALESFSLTAWSILAVKNDW